MSMLADRLTATLSIAPTCDLAAAAEKVGQALGLHLEPDHTGKYEEYPAFRASVLGLEIVLLGEPDPVYDIRSVKTRGFVLQVWSTDYAAGAADEADISALIAHLVRTRSGLVASEELPRQAGSSSQ